MVPKVQRWEVSSPLARIVYDISHSQFTELWLKSVQWFGGGVVVCPGVTIGRGCTIGAGSVVTKDVPDYHVAAGNPARLIRKIEVDEAAKKVRGTTRI